MHVHDKADDCAKLSQLRAQAYIKAVHDSFGVLADTLQEHC